MFDRSLSAFTILDDAAEAASLPATILLLEDHHDEVVFMTHLLTRAGFRVVQAYGGEDAMRKMKTQRIDLLMTDLKLPKVSGVQVIAEAKADPDTRDIPVLVVTGYTWDEQGLAALVAGADGFITKPFTNQGLIQEVKKRLNASGQLRLECVPLQTPSRAYSIAR